MKDKAFGNRKYKWIICVVCLTVVIAGGVYYYGILLGVMPNGEELIGIQNCYLQMERGGRYSSGNVLSSVTTVLSVMIGGLSFFSARLQVALLYTIVLGLTLYLAIRRSGKRSSLAMLPLWAFFMIFVHTIRYSSDFGKMYDRTDLIYWMPYSGHITALIFSLACIVFLQCYLDTKTRKARMVWGGLGFVIGVYALIKSDLIFYVVFVVPVLITLFFRGLYNDKLRKYVIWAVSAGIVIILATRIMPGEFCEALWSRQRASSYGVVYGATNWMDLDHILVHLGNYVKMILQLFNIDISDKPIISLYSVLFVVRITLVLIGYIIVARVIVSSIKGKIKDKGYTIVDEVLAWAFVLLSCAFVFTKYALYRDLMRYFGGLVSILTILLCRNITAYMEETFSALMRSIKNKKMYFAGILGALCICQMEPVWLYEEADMYQEDCEAAIEYIRQWGDGYVLAPYWLYARLSAMTNGEIIFYPNEETIKELYGEDAQMRYMIVGWDEDGLLTYELNEFAYLSYDEMCEKYRTPAKAVELDYLYVCDFGMQ